MIRNSLLVSLTTLILIAFALLNRLNFLAPWKKILLSHCGASIAVFATVLGLNLFAGALAVNRKLLLKDTGRKLTHFDNQIQMESPEILPPNLLEKR